MLSYLLLLSPSGLAFFSIIVNLINTIHLIEDNAMFGMTDFVDREKHFSIHTKHCELKGHTIPRSEKIEKNRILPEVSG